MSELSDSGRDTGTDLDLIETSWPQVANTHFFVARYATAIRAYLGAMLRSADDVEEVAQEFLLRVVEHGFGGADPSRGRFRDYLKVAVRNAAVSHLRRRHGRPESLDDSDVPLVAP